MTEDEITQIDSQYDILTLKGKTKYYFRYDEELEEKYVEIE